MKHLFLGAFIIGLAMTSCSKSNQEEIIEEEDFSIPASIDLGLSVNWSVFNYGAMAPWEYGTLYGWGGPAGKEINDQNYPTINDIANTQYDIIANTWGNGYRLPSDAELSELMDKCTWTYVSVNNVKGYKVTGPNGNSIFIPASGYYKSEIKERSERAFLWSSEKFFSDNGSALHIHETYQFMSFTPVNEGLSVRGVTPKKVDGRQFDLTYETIQDGKEDSSDPLRYTPQTSKTVYVTGFISDEPIDIKIPQKIRLSAGGELMDVVGIAASAFKNSKNLLSVEIPSSITYIEYGAFANCTNLKKVDYNAPKANEDNSLYWSNPVFENCTNLKQLNLGKDVFEAPFYFFKAMNIEELVIPDNVEIIHFDAFASCLKLKTITIGKGVRVIPQSSFALNDEEKNNLPTTVYVNAKKIENYSGHGGGAGWHVPYMPFMNRNVTKIVFGSSVESLCSAAFSEVTPSVIECHSTTPPTLGIHCFDITDKQNCKLYVPVGTKSKYMSAYIWKDFKNIIEGFE